MKKLRQRRYKSVKIKEVEIFYEDSLGEWGVDFRSDFVPVVKKEFGKVNHICEFGCGAGFIGFSLLANNLCKKLTLIDINPLAIEACNLTVKKNKLESKVKTYVSDVFKKVPKSQKWDLVVSNPPHFEGRFSGRSDDILLIDKNWEIHKKFYKNIKPHLTRNGSVLFVENSHGSGAELWNDMIKKYKLNFIKTFQYQKVNKNNESVSYVPRTNRFRNIYEVVLALISGRIKLRISEIMSGRNPYYFVLSKKP